MRVGQFTNAYHPFISGVVHSVDLIHQGMNKRGHTSFVFAPEYRGYQEESEAVYRFRSLEMSRKVRFPIPIPFSTRLFPLISNLGLDLCHSHHPLLLGDVAAHFARKLKVPLVYTFHTQFEEYSHYIPLGQSMVKTLARSTITAFTQKCDLVIAPSPTIRRLLEDYEVGCPVETLENAIDLKAFSRGNGHKIRKRLGLPAEATVAVYAGRIGREKNLAFMLNAFARLSTGVDWRLLLVGNGAELELLQAQAQTLGLAGRVIFTGPLEYSEMPDLYAAADLFVMTSTTEVKPLVVIEAMAGGLPVVAVAACGTEDTLTHESDGLLSDLDEERYGRQLKRALESPEQRERWGRNARRTASRYGIESYTQRLESLYGELIARKRRGGDYEAVRAV